MVELRNKRYQYTPDESPTDVSSKEEMDYLREENNKVKQKL